VGILRAIRDAITTIRDTKKALAESMRLDEEIRRRRITMATDLDHALLEKIIRAMPDRTDCRIFLRSGETIEIVKPGYDDKPAEKEGPGW
jgi:hypothetical protein